MAASARVNLFEPIGETVLGFLLLFFATVTSDSKGETVFLGLAGGAISLFGLASAGGAVWRSAVRIGAWHAGQAIIATAGLLVLGLVGGGGFTAFSDSLPRCTPELAGLCKDDVGRLVDIAALVYFIACGCVLPAVLWWVWFEAQAEAKRELRRKATP